MTKLDFDDKDKMPWAKPPRSEPIINDLIPERPLVPLGWYVNLFVGMVIGAIIGVVVTLNNAHCGLIQ